MIASTFFNGVSLRAYGRWGGKPAARVRDCGYALQGPCQFLKALDSLMNYLWPVL
jgi:hypothetical protein